MDADEVEAFWHICAEKQRQKAARPARRRTWRNLWRNYKAVETHAFTRLLVAFEAAAAAAAASRGETIEEARRGLLEVLVQRLKDGP